VIAILIFFLWPKVSQRTVGKKIKQFTMYTKKLVRVE